MRICKIDKKDSEICLNIFIHIYIYTYTFYNIIMMGFRKKSNDLYESVSFIQKLNIKYNIFIRKQRICAWLIIMFVLPILVETAHGEFVLGLYVCSSYFSWYCPRSSLDQDQHPSLHPRTQRMIPNYRVTSWP